LRGFNDSRTSHRPSKKLRSCAVRPPVPLMGAGAGGVALTAGKLPFFPMSLFISNASGVDSGENCAGEGFTGAAAKL